MRKIRYTVMTGIVVVVLLMELWGCKVKIVNPGEEKREAEFVIVSEECQPPEIRELIEKRKKDVMKITYVDENCRYIIVGYGEQKTGGYSISVDEFCVKDNMLYVDTCLLGPKDVKKGKECPSYPVIVIQTSELGLPVVFQ